jgi:hypothetical protein
MLQRGPLIAEISAGSKEFKFYESGIIQKCQLGPVNHAVTIVGYGQDYFIIKNSMGSDWGQKGFAKISTNACGILSYVVLPVI